MDTESLIEKLFLRFKIFGCLAYSWITKELRNKLDRKSALYSYIHINYIHIHTALFIGYYENIQGIQVL